MQQRESYVEGRVCAYAEELGIEHIKLNIQGKRGYPDRLFFVPGGKPLLIEFKRPGRPGRRSPQPTKLQEYRRAKLTALGYNIWCGVATVSEGRRALDAARLPA